VVGKKEKEVLQKEEATAPGERKVKAV